MKYFKSPILLLLIVSLLTVGCFEDSDDNIISASEINDFVWKGMNLYYLYKDEIPNLANDRFTNNEDYASYLNSYSSPDDLFESLIHQRETVDKYSWIVDDYIALEQFFSGLSTSNGMEYSLYLQPNSTTEVFGVARLILNNSDADNKGLERGDIFIAVDGVPLSSTNFSNLLSPNNYTLSLATYNDNETTETTDDTVVSNSETIILSKQAYTENPIYTTNTFNVNGENVGYLFYNGFTADFDTQLNNAFADFKANNIQHLILDLRYNSGGSVNSAILLSSMITGQFTGDVYSTEQWNDEFQQAFENENPELLINRFVDNDDGVALNSLNLEKVYILATDRSASASELVINSLDPYIDVVHIGDYTSGKYQASTTLYDSDNFRRDGANQSHTYAMQPLIFKSLNSVGKTDYDEGLEPDISLLESFNDLGIIGNENEKLLAAALADIENSGKLEKIKSTETISLQSINDSNNQNRFNNDMYIDKDLPEDLIRKILFE